MKNIIISKTKPIDEGFYVDKDIVIDKFNLKLKHVSYIKVDNHTDIFKTKEVTDK